MPGHGSKTFPESMATSANKLTNLEQIGCGGFGQVYKASHIDWGVVAYKKLPQQFIKETKAVKQMRKEITILQSLRHRNIISISGVIFEEGNYGIVLEFMKYGGLDNFLYDLDVPLPYKVRLALDVVLGMNYLHTLDKPIVHGDLKIQNVLVADGYLAKISDFGLSSWKDMSKTSSRSTGGYQGTVTHVPPERWLNVNLQQNQMEDVYAFGILLWEIFTEETPFSKLSSTVISAAVQSGQRPDVSHLPNDLPPVIRNLMDTSWHQDQAKRMPFKEIKETLERYTSEEAKKITASIAELQRQESLSSETSIECDGSSLVPSISGQNRASVETNHDLPIAQNECSGNSSAVDFGSALVSLKQDVKVDEANNAAVAASSLCAQRCGNVKEDIVHIDVKHDTYEGREGESGIRMAAGDGGRGARVAAGDGGSGLRVAAGDGVSGAREAAGGSLCTGKEENQLSSQLQSDLNIRPVQESNGRSIQVDSLSNPLLSGGIISLRPYPASDHHLSETLAKKVTQPKTVDDAPQVTSTAAGSLRDAGDAGTGFSLRSDPPSHQVGDVNLRSALSSLKSSNSTSNTLLSSQPKTVDATPHVTSTAAAAALSLKDGRDGGTRFSLHADPSSHQIGDLNLRLPSPLNSSHSTSDAPLSSQITLQPLELMSDRRLSHSQSVPEADAILSPDTQQRQPFSKEDEQSLSTLRAEEERNSDWNNCNIRPSVSDNNLDISHGYFPKDGGSFQKHVHPDNDQPRPAQPHEAHLVQPTVPQQQPFSTGFAGNRPGGYNFHAPMDQPLPTAQHYQTNTQRSYDGATWNALDRDSRPPKEANPKSHENASIIVKSGDKEVTIIHHSGSGIQIGNNNTMIINEPRNSRKKPDSGRPPAQSSSSSAFFSSGPAAATAGVEATKAPVIKKIVVPDKLVDQEVMIMVADNIGKEWMQLARQLGLQDSDIDGLNVDHRHLGIREVAYQMLRDWRERRGPEAKMQALARALVGVKRHDIALNLTQTRSKT